MKRIEIERNEKKKTKLKITRTKQIYCANKICKCSMLSIYTSCFVCVCVFSSLSLFASFVFSRSIPILFKRELVERSLYIGCVCKYIHLHKKYIYVDETWSRQQQQHHQKNHIDLCNVNGFDLSSIFIHCFNNGSRIERSLLQVYSNQHIDASAKQGTIERERERGGEKRER